MSILRIAIRTGFIVALSGMVIALTCLLIPASSASLRTARDIPRPVPVGDVATPGSEIALRRLIADVQGSRSIQLPMTAGLAERMRRTLPRDRQILKGLGSLKSVRYQGAGLEGDRYRTVFENGSLTWTIALRGGAAERLWFVAPEGPRPQDWIDWYALLPVDNGITRFVFGLIKLSVIAALGLVAGLRL